MNQPRFWEIDFLRGIALLAMLVSNTVTDLWFFKALNVNIYSGFWWNFAILVASTFIFLLGVSFSISYARAKKQLPRQQLFLKYLKRGFGIFAWGMAITFVTWLFVPEFTILFGILHFAGIAIILSFFFAEYAVSSFVLGITAIIAGFFLHNLSFSFPWLFWIGFSPQGFRTLDYFPLLPWFGVVLIGLAFGNRFYEGAKRQFSFPEFGRLLPARLICSFGRNSLAIYLLHQPVLISFLWLLGIIKPAFL